MTRFDCMIGSSGGMRMALAQAIDHCRQRAAFGKLLIEQPIMQNVLADLALETEAALMLTMRMARALDNRTDETEAHFIRIGTAIGKYWICKRTPGVTYEAMECIGGSGVMEDGPMPRLFRESPVNAIWEGSGNVQCLDVLRAMGRTPETLDVYFAEVSRAKGGNRMLDAHVEALRADMRESEDFELRARDLVDRLATGLQASLMVRHAPAAVADAFCASRLDARGAHQYGVLPKSVDCGAIVQRARPR